MSQIQFDSFNYVTQQDSTFLLGGYRSNKDQLSWILGNKTGRYEKLYNIRMTKDLFSLRNGGVQECIMPDYVLIYDIENVSVNYHLFPCISYSVKSESDMVKMQYPNPQGDYIVYLLGDEVKTEPLEMEMLIATVRKKSSNQIPHAPMFIKGKDIVPMVNEKLQAPDIVDVPNKNILRFIDLFAGIGGIRLGLEQAARDRGINTVCVFTSEIKPHAVKVLQDNHPTETITGDITQVKTKEIPDFDILCAGFPCQAFSSAGKRMGFADTRGTMFFEIERILRDKKPQGFILENVEGLVNHDGGKTLSIITERLDSLGYKFDFRVLNSKYFGVPQERKRIYIVGSKICKPNLDGFPQKESTLAGILETGCPTSNTPFVKNLLKHFAIEELYGKAIKDKRGGADNIHSWDLGIKGEVSKEQKQLLDMLLKERRKKKWAEIIGMDWMDGMPLTMEQIRTFYNVPHLQEMLDDLVRKDYLKYEHPKKLVKKEVDGVSTSYREYDCTKPKGYNIVAGKLSFEINKVLSPNDIAPTLVAMDMQKLYVADNGGLRRFTLREGLRLCGYPDDMIFDVSEKDGFDLLGNTVVVPVIKSVADRLLEVINF